MTKLDKYGIILRMDKFLKYLLREQQTYENVISVFKNSLHIDNKVAGMVAEANLELVKQIISHYQEFVKEQLQDVENLQ